MLTELAIKQHVARKLGLHPAAVAASEDLRSARCAQFPMTVFPITVEGSADAVTVRDGEPPQIDGARVRRWVTFPALPNGRWPIFTWV